VRPIICLPTVAFRLHVVRLLKLDVTVVIIRHVLLDQGQQLVVVVDGHKDAGLMHALGGLTGQHAHHWDVGGDAGCRACQHDQQEVRLG